MIDALQFELDKAANFQSADAFADVKLGFWFPVSICRCHSCRLPSAVYIISAMMKASRLFFAAAISAMLLFGASAKVSAQRNPTMPSQSMDNLKENLYAQFNEYRKSLNPEERRLAYPAARDYLRKYGGDDDTNARDVQKFVTEFERAVYDTDVFTAYNAKNYTKAFELGRAHLKADPNDFFVLATLTEAGYDNAVLNTLHPFSRLRANG